MGKNNSSSLVPLEALAIPERVNKSLELLLLFMLVRLYLKSERIAVD